jgi:hypothetical protein
MGTDITGWIEAKRPYDETGEWQLVLDLSWLYDNRDYDAFGCFFGIKNYAQFRPIAAERGLPSDASQLVKQYASAESNGVFGHTWMSWQEIKQIDWEEQSEHPDERIHRYERNEQGVE